MNTKKKHKKRQFRKQTDSQMILLMGITLALSVFVLSTLPAQLSDTTAAVPKIRSMSIADEFNQIKDAYGLAINYYFVDMDVDDNGNIIYYANHGKYTIRMRSGAAVSGTTQNLQRFTLQYHKFFAGSLIPNSLNFSHLSPEGHVYTISITVSLQNKDTFISQPVRYSILVNERLRTGTTGSGFVPPGATLP